MPVSSSRSFQICCWILASIICPLMFRQRLCRDIPIAVSALAAKKVYPSMGRQSMGRLRTTALRSSQLIFPVRLVRAEWMRAQPDKTSSFHRNLSSSAGCRKSAVKADSLMGDMHMADKKHSSDGFICHQRGGHDRA